MLVVDALTDLWLYALQTRDWAEVIASLKNMVNAAEEMRSLSKK